MSKYAKELPQDIEARKAVLSEVNKIVDAMMEINTLNNMIEDSKTYVQEIFGVDGDYVKEVANIKYDLLLILHKKVKVVFDVKS